jgi:hypothetical protein
MPLAGGGDDPLLRIVSCLDLTLRLTLSRCSEVAPAKPERARPRPARAGRGDIELEIDGVVVYVRRGAEAKTVAAVIKALKAVR